MNARPEIQPSPEQGSAAEPLGWGPRVVAPALAVLCLGALALVVVALRWGYHGSFVVLNAWSAPVAGLYRYLTQGGDALIGGGLMVLALLLAPGPRARAERLSLALLGIGALLGLGLLVQLLKRQVFGAWHRPMGLFEGVLTLAYTDAEGGRHFSFPSGHAQVVATAVVVVSYALRPSGQALAAGLGLLLAYGRVAVGMHYPLDLIAGAAVAVAGVLPLVAWRGAQLSRWLEGRSAGAQRRWRLGLLALAGVALVAGLLIRFAR